MDLNYANEKYSVAVYALATGTGSIQQRLMDAALSLMHAPGPGVRNDAPEEIEQRIVAQNDRLSATLATGDEGNLAATIFPMSDDEAVREAREVVETLEALHAAELDA